MSAEVDGDTVEIALDGFTSDSRKKRPDVAATVEFSVEQGAGGTVVGPEEVTFDFALTIGIGPEFGPLVGGVKGRMAGVGAKQLAATELRSG